MLLRSCSFMVGDNKGKTKVSIKLMASLAPARAEIKAGIVGIVAKADQNLMSFKVSLFQMLQGKTLVLCCFES